MTIAYMYNSFFKLPRNPKIASLYFENKKIKLDICKNEKYSVQMLYFKTLT